jgi:hypothetical protein
MMVRSVVLWFGVVAVGLSQGLGDERLSIGADTGVGRVEAVAAVEAVLGVISVVEADRGVYGVRDLGESSGRADRMAGSVGVLPDRKRVSEICLVRRGMRP